VYTISDQRRAVFNSGDRVHFDFRGRQLQGVLLRVNPRRGHVAADDGQEYRVPYSVLEPLDEHAISAPVARSQAQMEEIVQLAHDLLAHHQLPRWSFQFDNGTKRAGCCHYGTYFISLASEFAKRAPEEEIRETLLHEIAHALVGKAHHHDEVWRAKALEIGCSGRRCHALQFTPPRYIVKCARGCWVATAERRQRGVICKQCRGNVMYETYTEEHWCRENRESTG
jgi:predicted SprT family Zn-dependent metalloprotease